MIAEVMVCPRLLVCITFPFRKTSLSDLFHVLLALSEIRSASLDVRIFTDCTQQGDQSQIRKLAEEMSFDRIQVSVETCGLGDEDIPLSWAHKSLLRSSFSDDKQQDYSHFVYLDDLIRFSSRNLFYFLKYRPILRPFGLIPGFVQVEFSAQAGMIVLPDLPEPTGFDRRGVVDLGDVDFIGLDAPFVPMYVMDVNLVKEYLASPASDLEVSRNVIGWGDAQRSAMGLTFADPPQTHRWRVAIPIVRSRGTPHQGAWVHHVSNTLSAHHAVDPQFPLGRIGLGDMLVKD